MATAKKTRKRPTKQVIPNSDLPVDVRVCILDAVDATCKGAYVVGTDHVLAVHPSHVDAKLWEITHMPTGTGLLTTCASRQEAEEIASWLWLNVLDRAAFNSSSEHDACAAMPPAIRAVLMAYQNKKHTARNADACKRVMLPFNDTVKLSASLTTAVARYNKLVERARLDANLVVEDVAAAKKALAEATRQRDDVAAATKANQDVAAALRNEARELEVLRNGMLNALLALDATGALSESPLVRQLRAVRIPDADSMPEADF
jgi:hypothetical protein